MRFKVLTAVTIKNIIGDVTPCSLVDGPTRPSETLVPTYETTRRHNTDIGHSSGKLVDLYTLIFMF
jgi:hypothetical protein